MIIKDSLNRKIQIANELLTEGILYIPDKKLLESKVDYDTVNELLREYKLPEL